MLHDICMHCLKEKGHTEFCPELRKTAINSNITRAVNYACSRAILSGYKQLMGEKDPNLVSMWEKSAESWCQSAINMIAGANSRGELKNIYMPDA